MSAGIRKTAKWNFLKRDAEEKSGQKGKQLQFHAYLDNFKGFSCCPRMRCWLAQLKTKNDWRLGKRTEQKISVELRVQFS